MRQADEPVRRQSHIGKFVAVGLKLAVTAACFWYVGSKIDLAEFARTVPTIDLRWVSLAVLVAALQVPLVGLRWSAVLDALPGARVSRPEAIAITWIAAFLGQVLPYAAGDAMRVWLVSRLGRDWRTGLVSVLIDRGAAVAMLFAYGLVILLMPSALTALQGYRGAVLIVFAAVTAGAFLALASAPWIRPMLSGWRYTRWIGTVVALCNDVLLRSRAGIVVFALAFVVHTLTILCIWCIGRSLGIALPLIDAAVLFVLMLGVALIPISIGGWGLREVAVVTLLASHGVPTEIAFSLSVSFGMIFVLASLPGAIVWAGYSPARAAAAKAET
jgi:glycosyltransferase 2 family protein